MRFRDPGHYDIDPEDAEFLESLTLRPVAPDDVEDRLAGGDRLETVDVPRYLGKQFVVDADASVVLYRLVQLFGTPNVPGLEAGADQPARERTTWHYLFAVEVDDEEPLLVSVYDYETNVSVGLSAWRDGPGDRAVPEPREDPPEDADLPGEDLLVSLAKLVLYTVESPVPATYKGLMV